MTAYEATQARQETVARAIDKLLECMGKGHEGNAIHQLNANVMTICNALASYSYSLGYEVGYNEGWDDHKHGKDQRQYDVHLN